MFEFIQVIAIATLPVFILLYYFWRRDKGEKEPMKLMKRIFWAGAFVTIPIVFIELLLQFAFIDLSNVSPTLFLLVSSFALIALPEELGKLWVVKTKVFNHPKFNEVMDGITYCIIASMGFAIFENVLYTMTYGAGTGLLRAFTAVPAHALFSGIMGHYIGLAKFKKTKKEQRRLLWKGLAAGVFFHGLYDALLLSGQPLLILCVLPLLVYMGVILNRAIKHANKGLTKEIKYA